MMKYSSGRNQARESILKIVDFERVFHKNNEEEMLCSLHNILYPELFDLLMDVTYPGFIEKEFPSLKNLLLLAERNKSIRILLDILSLISHQLDVFKDSLLAITLLTLMGGPSSLLDFPSKFTSVVIFTFSLLSCGLVLLCCLKLCKCIVTRPALKNKTD